MVTSSSLKWIQDLVNSGSGRRNRKLSTKETSKADIVLANELESIQQVNK
jgi:hypothetical protein